MSFITDVNPYAKTIQVSRDTDPNATGGIVNPFTNVSTVIVDQDNLPLPNATIIVVEDHSKHSTSNDNGQVSLEQVDRNHSVQINFAGAEIILKVSELPAQVVFTDEMLTHQLDTVYINGKPKSKTNWFAISVIGVCLTGVVYTVAKAMNEEKAQPIHL